MNCRASIGGHFPPEDYFESLEKGHGRIEQRRITALDGIILSSGFPFICQVAKIDRTRTIISKKAVEQETVYGITSLHRSEADAEKLAKIARNQWQIEAHHYIRDVTFGEDGSRLRKGNGAEIMAAIRNLVTAILRLAGAGAGKIAKSIRSIMWNDKKTALRLIGLK